MFKGSFLNSSFLGNPIDVGVNIARGLLNSLLWYYELDEISGPRFDSGSNNLVLAETGTVDQEPGVIDEAASFSGASGNTLTHINDALYDLSTADFTLSGWVYFDSKISARVIQYIGIGTSSAADLVMQIFYASGTDCIRFQVSNGTTVFSVDDQISSSIPVDTWIFVAATVRQSDKLMTIRLNGQSSVSTNFTGTINNPGTQTYATGSTTIDTANIDGKIDEIGGWDRLLTDTEIDFLFNGSDNNLMQTAIWYYRLEEASGTRKDSSNSTLDLSETGTVGQLAGIIDESASFPGSTGNYLAHAFDSLYDFSAKDVTVTGWVYFDALTSNQEIVYVGTANRTAAAMVFDIRLFAGSDNVQTTISDGTSTETLSAGVVVADVWNFFCMRYNFTTKLLEIRLNGNVFVTSTLSLLATNSPGAQEFVIGQHLTANNMDGRIDEVGGWDRILTNAEVDTLYNSGLARRPEFGAARPQFQQFITNADGTRVANADGDLITT